MKTTILTIMFVLLAITAHCAEHPDYTYPVAGWTSEELEQETLKCVSSRLREVRTETATLMLEKICFYDVIAKGMDQ